MMLKSEMSKLLALCAGYDKRTTGTQDVEAWMMAIGDLDPRDCALAIAHYYRMQGDQRGDPITVGAIYAGVQRIRNVRLTRADPVRFLPEVDPDDVSTWLRELRSNIADVAADHSEDCGAAGRLGIVPAIEAKL